MRWNIRSERVVCAATASAVLILLRNFSWLTVAWILFIAATALMRDRGRTSFLLLILLGLSLAARTDQGAAGILTAGVFSGILLSDSFPPRILLAASLSCILIYGTLGGILFLLAVSAVACIFGSRKKRIMIIAGGLAASLPVTGLPIASTAEILVHDEIISNGSVLWTDQVRIDLSRQELLLEAENRDGSQLIINVSAGGVRDSRQMGIIESGDIAVPIYPGETEIVLTETVFPVQVSMIRKWKPFNHPVIWIQSAGISP